MNSVYQSLSQDEKINIFKRCQELLIRDHPDSEFIIRKSFLTIRNKSLETLIKLYKEFNGNVYFDQDCLIFYKIFNLQDGLSELYKKYDKPSDDDGNTIFIIFATFDRQKTDIKQLIEKQLENKIEKISFSREGKFKFYNLQKFSSKFF